MPTKITEAIAAIEAKPTGAPGRFQVRIISKGLGSSGYYPASTIESAVKARIWPKGTHLYMDHPDALERELRPERTLRDLVGVLDADASWNADDQAAEAVAKIYAPYRPLLEEMADDIGLSIRASAEVTAGEADGYRGAIVTELVEGHSVDFVTKAGRGGRVLAVLESARPAEAVETLTSDRRDQLDRAVSAAWADRDRDRYAWVRDFDEDLQVVYFDAESKTWRQSYTPADDDLSVTLTGTRHEVRAVTQYHPVDSSGATTTHQEAAMPQIEEARLAALIETESRVSTLESERDTAIQRAEAAEARVRTTAREAYDAQVSAALEAANLPDAARDRVADALALAEGADVPDNARGVIEAAITTEREYLAKVATAPAKRPLGFGGTTTPAVESYTNPWGRTISQEA